MDCAFIGFLNLDMFTFKGEKLTRRHRLGKGLAGLRVRWSAFLLIFVSASAVFAQPPFEVPLRVIVGVNTSTMYFGVLPGADRCFNPADCFNGHCEFDLPPLPPQGIFDMRFAMPCGSISGSSIDFRPFVSAAQRDTFRTTTQPSGSLDPVAIRWSAGLSAYFTQLTLRYFDRNLGQIVNINMLTDTTADVAAAGYPTMSILSGGLAPSVDEMSPQIPARFLLSQNYPNPFNPSTRIRFSIPTGRDLAKGGQISDYGFVSLKVYDVLGREAATLVQGEQTPGEHTIEWTAERVASGNYIYRLTANDVVLTGKMLLLR